jgi:LysR family transcriptional regulator, chromosome initiation inhibitor
VQFDRRQLEALAACVNTGSLTAAAQALHLSVAAISLRIRALEDQAGKRLLVRGKRAIATAAGNTVLASFRQLQLIESDLANALQPEHADWQSLSVAINADSIASWVVPHISASLIRHKLLIDVLIDDQDHTMQWLQQGQVVGCISTASKTLRGCISEPLGRLRYRCLMSCDLAMQVRERRRSLTVHELLATPVVCFNRKDQLQDQFLALVFGLKQVSLRRHYLGSVEAFHEALLAGLGWGMECELQSPQDVKSGRLVEALPGKWLETPLFWHHWKREAPQAARLTQAMLSAGKRCLRQAA